MHRWWIVYWQADIRFSFSLAKMPRQLLRHSFVFASNNPFLGIWKTLFIWNISKEICIVTNKNDLFGYGIYVCMHHNLLLNWIFGLQLWKKRLLMMWSCYHILQVENANCLHLQQTQRLYMMPPVTRAGASLTRRGWQ